MNLHEYQAKEILARYGVPVPSGMVTDNLDDVERIAKEIGKNVVIKAQVHAGGRGKAGGIKIAEIDKAKDVASTILGMRLVSPQTGPDGRLVRKILVSEAIDVKKEYYLGITIDRSAGRPIVLMSSEGGVEIEEVAAKMPEKIIRVTVDPAIGILPYQARNLAYGAGLGQHKDTVKIILAVYKTFVENDCSLVEINPLVETKDGRILALDAKISLDDNALYRHKDLEDKRDKFEEDPKEVEAKDVGISYVKLDGNIGCLVNGAGLAMATMDIIKLYGGMPANFLDVGGGANKEQVARAFKILLSDKQVKAVLVNIFGGIMRCDVLAQGVVDATKEMGVRAPLVVRLEGTNVDKGREILKESGLSIIPATTMADAAEKVVKAISTG
ncbi:MAG TPA: ADP-forming succinate--CoA ligase subunit beta [bacterium]